MKRLIIVWWWNIVRTERCTIFSGVKTSCRPNWPSTGPSRSLPECTISTRTTSCIVTWKVQSKTVDGWEKSQGFRKSPTCFLSLHPYCFVFSVSCWMPTTWWKSPILAHAGHSPIKASWWRSLARTPGWRPKSFAKEKAEKKPTFGKQKSQISLLFSSSFLNVIGSTGLMASFCGSSWLGRRPIATKITAPSSTAWAAISCSCIFRQPFRRPCSTWWKSAGIRLLANGPRFWRFYATCPTVRPNWWTRSR